ncbi:hypothetical protein [Streptomyces sp. NBC_01373]|uniref:hypothetical protein n=1 Tax=Streptomyces sp. NBC_01373 TaxID=2903843 RepID=UPI00338EC964
MPDGFTEDPVISLPRACLRSGTGNRTALDVLVQGIERAGLRPGYDVGIAIDIAATQFQQEDGAYRLAAEDRELTSTALVEELAAWCAGYPIVSLEDAPGRGRLGRVVTDQQAARRPVAAGGRPLRHRPGPARPRRHPESRERRTGQAQPDRRAGRRPHRR